jgi:HNH endonuclease
VTLEEQFMQFVSPEPNSGCWLWDGDCFNDYGRFNKDWAHRVSYRFFVGQIPKKKQVLHHCDIGVCVNPDHLFIGTQKDNLRDCVQKGRNGYKAFHGESHWKSKFTAEEVLQIKSSPLSRRELALLFGVSELLIKHVRSSRAWKQLRGETRVGW